MADITLLGSELSGSSVIIAFRFNGRPDIKQMLAGDILRSPMIVAALSDVDLATVSKCYAMEFGN